MRGDGCSEDPRSLAGPPENAAGNKRHNRSAAIREVKERENSGTYADCGGDIRSRLRKLC